MEKKNNLYHENKYKDKGQIQSYKLIKFVFIFLLILIINIYYFISKDTNKEKYKEIIKEKNIEEINSFNLVQDNITLVSTLFKTDTNRHNFEDYYIWIEKLFKINKPIIFFTQSDILEKIKEKRPKIYENKTIWIERNFSDLYSYKNYLNKFNETYIIDKAKSRHTVELFVVWCEKVNFMKEAIENNYFKSKYFFWVDAGFFRDDITVDSFINNWPSIEKLEKDPRVTLDGIREITKEEFNKLINFDNTTHDKFMNDVNISANCFAGRYDYLIKFIKFYYEILELLYRHNKFIGSEQNIFTFIAHLHPEITNVIISGDNLFFKKYFYLY